MSNPQQNEANNANVNAKHQFSNSQPLTFSQTIKLLNTLEKHKKTNYKEVTNETRTERRNLQLGF